MLKNGGVGVGVGGGAVIVNGGGGDNCHTLSPAKASPAKRGPRKRATVEVSLARLSSIHMPKAAAVSWSGQRDLLLLLFRFYIKQDHYPPQPSPELSLHFAHLSFSDSLFLEKQKNNRKARCLFCTSVKEELVFILSDIFYDF